MYCKMIYLVFAPSKSGTTSLYQMLTENSKFPVIQTHGDFQEVGIHDSLESSAFTCYVKAIFCQFLKPTNEFDSEVEWMPNTFDSYALYFTDGVAKHNFIEFLRQHPLRIISPFREPVSRSVSAMIHWLDESGINALYKTKLDKEFDINDIRDDDMEQLQHYPIEQILGRLKNGPLTICDVTEIHNNVFKEDLYREYICVFYILRMYFGFNVCLKDRSFYHAHLEQNNWEFFTFRLEDIKKVEDKIKTYLTIDQRYALPRARNKENRKKYVIEGDISNIAKVIEQNRSHDSSLSFFNL